MSNPIPGDPGEVVDQRVDRLRLPDVVRWIARRSHPPRQDPRHLGQFPGRFAAQASAAASAATSAITLRCSASDRHWSALSARTLDRIAPKSSAWASTSAQSSQFDDHLTASAFMMADMKSNQIASFYPGPSEQAQRNRRASPRRPCPYALLGATGPETMRKHTRELGQAPVQADLRPGVPDHHPHRRRSARGIDAAWAVIGNDYEFAMIERKTGLSIDAIAERCELVVVTYGEQGSELRHERSQRASLPAAPTVGVKDPTGAGDAYRAGLIKGLLLEQELEIVGRIAGLTAVHAVEHVGTQEHTYAPDEFVDRFDRSFPDMAGAVTAEMFARFGKSRRDTGRLGWEETGNGCGGTKVRHQGRLAGARGTPPDRLGRAGDAGPAADPRAFRGGEAAQGRPHARLRPHHDRDRQPRADPPGRRRRRRPLRQQPALDPGRRRRRAGRRGHPGLRDQGRGRRDLLPPHHGRARSQAAHRHRRRRRCRHDAPLDPHRAARRRHRRHRGDDHRHHPRPGAGQGRRPQVPDHRRQRRRHQALLRQPLRHRPEHDRRHPPRHQHPARRQDRRRRRLRLVRQGHRDAAARHGRPGDRDRDRPRQGARSGHGRLPR